MNGRSGGGGGDGVASMLGDKLRYEVGPSQLTEATTQISSPGLLFFIFIKCIVFLLCFVENVYCIKSDKI